MDFKQKLKKAFQLDTYAIGAGNRNVNRLRWFLQNAPGRLRSIAKVHFNRPLRNDLRAREQSLKVDNLLAQIDPRELSDFARTYATDAAPSNPGETHVSGTFQYNEIDINLPVYQLADGKRYGVRLAGKVAEEPAQYRAAVDTGQVNQGNYGVLYNVSVDAVGGNAEAAQVLLNPRAVGKKKGAHVTNGYAGVVDVPAAATGRTPTGPPIPAES